MQTDSLPSVSRVSKRIRKLKTDLHLTLTKPKSHDLRLKLPLQSLFQSSCKHPTFLSSLMYFPGPLRKTLKDKMRLIREDIDELCESLPMESDKPMGKEIQDMRLLMRNQDQRLQELCHDTLGESTHDSLRQYLKTLVSRDSPLNLEEINGTPVDGFPCENYHLGQVFNEESICLTSVKGFMQRSIGSGVSLNETTQEGGSKENSFEVFNGFRENNAKFYWKESMNTPSTTPNTSKRNSPIFSEKKNLLLSSKIEDIINEGDEIFCRRFEEENMSFEDGMEEKQMNFDFFLKGQEPETSEKFDEEFGALKKINESLILADNDNLPFF